MAALATVAGCAGAPTVVDLPTGGIDRDQELGGEWPVVVAGMPFPGVPPDALARLVAAEMPTGFGYNVTFVPAPPGVQPDRRIAWVFGGALAGGDGSAVCQSPAGGGPQGGHLRAYAAVCRGPSALYAVQADVEGVTSPDAPGFRRLIDDSTIELFSPHSDQEHGLR